VTDDVTDDDIRQFMAALERRLDLCRMVLGRTTGLSHEVQAVHDAGPVGARNAARRVVADLIREERERAAAMLEDDTEG
jgi:hypothetical protein